MMIKVNGQDRQAPEDVSIFALLQELQLTPEKVAVELNRRLIRTERYGEALRDGDEVEIVTFVGGG